MAFGFMRGDPAGRSIYRTLDGQRRIRSWCDDVLAAWPQPHVRLTVATSLGATHVVRTGEGPDLVLLPGTNFCTATWLELIGTLASTHTVHAVDLPGQPGLSAARRPRGGGQRYGGWLAELMRSLDVGRPMVVGHSLGGAIALRAAAQGTPMHRLILLDPAGVIRLRVSAAVMRPTLPWLLHPQASTSAALLKMMMAPGAQPLEDHVAWMTLVGAHVRSSLAPAPIPGRELRRLAGAPVEILSGRHDAFLPSRRIAERSRRRLPSAKVTIVEHAGHLLPHERPLTVLQSLSHGSGTGMGGTGMGGGSTAPPARVP